MLDRLKAEIVQVTSSAVTCRGAANTTGGSMIDYFMISRSLLGVLISVLADFSSCWAPHFGIELKISAELDELENLALVRPTLPKGLPE